jgi:hypothetical protein
MTHKSLSITCFKCKEKKSVNVSATDMTTTKLGRSLVHAACPTCGRKMTTLITNDLSKQLKEEEKCPKGSEESLLVYQQTPEQGLPNDQRSPKVTGSGIIQLQDF